MSLSENFAFLSACIQAGKGLSWIYNYILCSNAQGRRRAPAQGRRTCEGVRGRDLEKPFKSMTIPYSAVYRRSQEGMFSDTPLTTSAIGGPP